MFWLFSAALILSACLGAQAPTAATNAGCIEFARINFDRLNDTLPTIEEIRTYDDQRDKLCGAGH